LDKYPTTTLLRLVYTNYYLAYMAQGNVPKTIEYVDKLMSLGDEVDLSGRLQALAARASVYLRSCGDTALETPDAYTAARDAAKQGRRILSQWQKPQVMPEDAYEGQKNSLAKTFDSVTAITESGLRGDKASSCSRSN